MSGPRGLRVLAVDDEPPALDELGLPARADPRVESVVCAGDAAAALRLLRQRRRRRVPRHPDAGPGRARARPGAAPFRRTRRRSSSSPPTTTTRSTRSTSARSTTCSSRCGRSGWPRRCAGCVGRALVRAGRRPQRRRRDHPGGAGGGPDAAARRRSARSRRRATTPGCTPRTAATWSASRSRRWRSAGPTPGSSASTGRTWSRCGDVHELRLTGSGYVVRRRRPRAAGQPPAHPRAPGPAGPRRQGEWPGTLNDPPG